MDDDFEDKIQSLQDEISQLSTVPKTITKNATTVKKQATFKLFNLNLVNSSFVYYGVVPCLILLLLLTLKPRFVMEDNVYDSTQQTEKKVSYKKLAVAIIIFTMIIKIMSVIYIFVYKTKTSEQ
jgi:hypothetical protein